MYTRHWTSLMSFLHQHSLPDTLPIHQQHIALFVTQLHNQGLRHTTIRTYISAISFVHKLRGFPDNTSHFLINKAVKGASKRQLQSPRKLLPITKSLLHQMCDSLSIATPLVYNLIIYKSFFLTSFYACTRIGELALSNADTHTLTLQDVTQISHDTKPAIQLNFRSFKHSKSPVVTILQSIPSDPYCPVAALNSYLCIRPVSASPYLFIQQGGGGLTRNDVSSMMKTCLQCTGTDPTHYNTHSFRIGRATQLSLDKASDDTIKSVGRWKSTAYSSYIRPSHVTLPK